MNIYLPGVILHYQFSYLLTAQEFVIVSLFFWGSRQSEVLQAQEEEAEKGEGREGEEKEKEASSPSPPQRRRWRGVCAEWHGRRGGASSGQCYTD